MKYCNIMSERHLHIISFDVPYPPDYGGVIDVYNRLKMLSQKGVKIHLHCYDYGRGQQKCLEDLCVEVKYYKRNTPLLSFLSRRPYIMQSRLNDELKKDLLKDDYPILCEGFHTAFLAEDKRFPPQRLYLRAHNIEHQYYRMLSEAEPVFWKRFFYKTESKKIENRAWILKNISHVIAISQTDADYFRSFVDDVICVPAFNSFERVMSKEGKGDYVLYHGNLSVRENSVAAERLVRNVFSKLGMRCVVAGHNPPKVLRDLASSIANVQLVEKLSDEAMTELIANAHINVLVTDQPTGMKLKLLNALYLGRHCLVNSKMLYGTGLDDLCLIADTDDALVEMLNSYIDRPFTESDISGRAAVLDRLCSSSAGADKIIEFIRW